MKKYNIDKDQQEVSEKEALKYKDFGKLTYNYQQAAGNLHRKPLYKNPKSFLLILIIVLLAWFIAEVVDKEEGQKDNTEQVEEQGGNQ